MNEWLTDNTFRQTQDKMKNASQSIDILKIRVTEMD